MKTGHDHLARWVAREILPYEERVRIALRRQWRGAIDVDDVIQEAYCRLAALESIDHIDSPLAYFRRAVHAAAVDALRTTNKNVVSMTENDWFDVIDERPAADRQLEATQELGRVDRVLGSLTEIARRVIELRRIDGLTQRETAERLGVSEHVVENHIVRGIRRMLSVMAQEDAEIIEGAEEREEARLGTSRSQ